MLQMPVEWKQTAMARDKKREAKAELAERREGRQVASWTEAPSSENISELPKTHCEETDIQQSQMGAYEATRQKNAA